MDILESSQNYRELSTLTEAQQFVADTANGWLDPVMPIRQYATVVHKELELFRAGGSVAPYDVLIRLINLNPPVPNAKLLDVGASSGYYSQVLAARGIPYHYTGVDFNPHFVEFARKVWDVEVLLADATDIYMVTDRSYDIVISGGMLMHTLDYAEAIREIQRIAKHQIIYHRTPVSLVDKTRYFAKEAYGLPCLEIHFNEDEIMDLFYQGGWNAVAKQPVSWDDETKKGQISYLFERA